MKINYSNKFVKEYKKLPKEIKDLAEKAESIFNKNHFDSRLKTHKLHGCLDGFWSFSINIKYRVIFEFDSDYIIFRSIGKHDIYK